MLFCCFATLLKEYNISSTTCQVMLNFLITFEVKHFKFIFQNVSIYFALNLINLLSKLSGKKLYAISTYRQTCMYIYQHTSANTASRFSGKLQLHPDGFIHSADYAILSSGLYTWCVFVIMTPQCHQSQYDPITNIKRR